MRNTNNTHSRHLGQPVSTAHYGFIDFVINNSCRRAGKDSECIKSGADTMTINREQGFKPLDGINQKSKSKIYSTTFVNNTSLSGQVCSCFVNGEMS